MQAAPISQDNASSGQSGQAQSHLVRLDVLRGIAILSVFLFHYQDAILHVVPLRWSGLWLNPGSAANVWTYILFPLSFGWAGVSLFFVISGFVIHLSFLRNPTFNLGQFYTRRFWRIYPPYLLALCVFAFRIHMVKTPAGVAGAGAAQFLSHLFLVHNLRQQWFFGIVSPFWSLALEAQFYLIYPLLLLIRKRVGMTGALGCTLGLSLLCRLVAGLFLINWQVPFVAVITRFVAILWFDWTLGAYVAEQFHAGRRAFRIPLAAWGGLVVLLVLATFFKPTDLLSYSLAAFIAAVFIDSYVWSQGQLSKVEAALVPLGLCSYSFYLWHEPLITFFHSALHRLHIPDNQMMNMSLALVLVFACIYGLSWLLYRSVEQWGVALGKRLGQRGRLKPSEP